MSRTRAAAYWFGGVVLLVIVLYLLRSILLPFVIGMVTAYFLDPAADKLEKWGCSRLLATSLLTLLFLVVAIGLVLLIVPVLYRQALDLAAAIPGYANSLRDLLIWAVDQLQDRISPDDLAALKQSMSKFAGDSLKWLGRVFASLWSGGMAFFEILSLIFVTPVVAFYLLKDWDGMVARVREWIPPRNLEDMRGLGLGIDRRLSGFIRGQSLVCLALGSFYAIGLSVAGLRFGFLIGIMAGLLAFIPYVGTAIGFVTAVGLAFVQFDDWMRIAIVAAIFLIGQVVEGNFLQPKLVGDRVGLHPVWIIFAMFAGGALMGFLGVVLAVPLAAIIGEVGRYALRRYLASPLYDDSSPPRPPPTPASTA